MWVPFLTLSGSSFKQKCHSGVLYAGLEHPAPHPPLVKKGENFSESVSICVWSLFLPSTTGTGLFCPPLDDKMMGIENCIFLVVVLSTCPSSKIE